MKQMKRALAIILAVMMLIGMVPVASMAAPQFTRLGNSSIGYYLDEDGTLTLRGRGSTPDFHDGSSPFDFRYDNDLYIKKVVVEEGITRLGNLLFIGCPMESISLPASLQTIGEYTLTGFYELVELDFSENLTNFGRMAFSLCDNLRKVTFHASSISCFALFGENIGLMCGVNGTTISIPLPFTIHETDSDTTTVIKSNSQAEEVFLTEDNDYINNKVQCLNDCALVTWKDADGSLLSQIGCPVGEMPVFKGDTPQKAADNENHYRFTGWNDGTNTYAPDSLPAAASDVTYTAVYSLQAHTYGAPVWTWSEDKSSATAQFVCTDDDCAYQVTKDAVITREVRENKLVFSAAVSFNGNTYTDEYEQAFTGGYLIQYEQSEHGTVEADKYYAESGETVTLSFHPEEGYTLAEYEYKYYSVDGTVQSGGSYTTSYYDTLDYEITVRDSTGEGGYLVITPVFVRAYRIIDNTGGQLNFHRASIGDKTDKGIAGMSIYVYPNDFIGYDNGDGVGKIIESMTVTDDKGQEIEVDVHTDAYFTMPESDVTVNATISETKYRVNIDYDPIRDHGIVRSQSKSILSPGETYIGKVESWFPYILTGLYAEDADGNRTDLIESGAYNAETGIVSFEMPAKPLTIYRTHEIDPDYHEIKFDEQSYATAEGIGFITRIGTNYLGGITGDKVNLNVRIMDSRYGLSTLYYIDKNGEKVDLMPSYNKEDGEFTFTMPDSDITVYYSFKEWRTVTLNEYTNEFTITGFAGDTTDFEIMIDDYAQTHAKLDATYFYYYDSNNEYVVLDADWDSETGKGTFVMPDEDITLHIKYMYNREVPEGAFEHGTITADKEKVIDGEIITYTVHPQDGWMVTELGIKMDRYSTTGTRDENNKNIWYVTMPQGWSGNIELRAIFEEDPDWHSITIEQTANGSISYGRSGADTGDAVTLNVTPDSGYALDSITVIDAQQNAVAVEGKTFTMPASDVTVKASFKKVNNGVNLTIGSDITSNYYIDYLTYETAAKVVYTYNSVNEKEQNVPKTVEIDLKNIPSELLYEDRIRLTVSQAPAQMAENTHIVILDNNGEEIDALDYSAKSYCDKLIAMGDEALAEYAGSAKKAAALKTLAHSLIAYAEAAQGVFASYETTKVTCEDEALKAQIAAASATPSFTVQNDGEITFSSVSFVCTKDARLRFYLNTDGATSTPQAPQASSGRAQLKYTTVDNVKKYFVELSGIDAARFGDKITVTYGGSTIEFSVLDFAGIVLKEDSTASEAQKLLAKTLVVYNTNALAYFGE